MANGQQISAFSADEVLARSRDVASLLLGLIISFNEGHPDPDADDLLTFESEDKKEFITQRIAAMLFERFVVMPGVEATASVAVPASSAV